MRKVKKRDIKNARTQERTKVLPRIERLHGKGGIWTGLSRSGRIWTCSGDKGTIGVRYIQIKP